MGANWKKKTQPELILNRYKEISSATENNRVQFSGFEAFDLDPQINRMIDYGENFSFHTKKHFRDKAIRTCIRSNKITKEEYIYQINKEISIYKNKVAQEFTIVTSISIAENIPFRSIKLPNATITGHKSTLPKKYQDRSSYNDSWKKISKNESPLPENYTIVTVKVKERSEEEAAEVALNNLDYVRGIIGFLVNPQASYNHVFGSSVSKPLNKVMLGGMHTLHKKNGKLATENSFWYESNYKEIDSYIIKKEKIKTIKTELTRIIKITSEMKKPDRDQIISAITKYARALDDQDRNVIIQKLWSILESLTAKNENNCDKLVRRCSYLFKESDYVSQILEGIRDYRNQYIHAGFSEEELDSHCYQLQKIFRRLIGFYLSTSKTFRDLEEANTFLDLPTTKTGLSEEAIRTERKLELIKKALEYRFREKK